MGAKIKGKIIITVARDPYPQPRARLAEAVRHCAALAPAGVMLGTARSWAWRSRWRARNRRWRSAFDKAMAEV